MWYAVPIVLTQLIGGIKLLNEFIKHVKYLSDGSVLRSGHLLDHEVKLHLPPFLVSRNDIILRGTVSYGNYLSQSTRTRH